MQHPGKQDARTGFSRSYWAAGLCLGLALAGFFDGIVLHQILQWHSLLSSLDGEIFKDLRFRILTDGLFHAVMYAIAVAGLWLLWRSRAQFDAPRSGRHFASTLLMGFGTWHLLDAVLNHWILGLHHIKENDSNWLLWDLAFFLVGAASLLVGLMLYYRPPGRDGGRGLPGMVASSVAVLVLGAGILSASPLTNVRSVTVVFKPGISTSQVMAAVQSIDGRMLWSNPDGDIWMLAVDSAADAWPLYRQGAIFVSGSFFGMGCFSATPLSQARALAAPRYRGPDTAIEKTGGQDQTTINGVG